MKDYYTIDVCQVTVNDRLALRGPHLLPFLRGFTHLSDLDLSMEKGSVGHVSNTLLIDDKTLVSFFQTLSMHFRTLQSLKMSHWRVTLDDCDKTLKTVGRWVHVCSPNEYWKNYSIEFDQRSILFIVRYVLYRFMAHAQFGHVLHATFVCILERKETPNSLVKATKLGFQ